jgi:predicted nuclease with TOPRIM domain
MTIMRESWTDERLDDLNDKVDRGFREVKVEIAELRSETNARFDKVDARFVRVDERMDAGFDKVDERMDVRFEKVDERFDKIDQRFDKIEDKIELRVTTRIDSLNRTLLGFAVAVIFLLVTSKIPF